MAIVKIPAESRGLTQLDWLTSYHSFSFGEYYDPERMGFGHLRVLNDDTVGGGGGFPPHPHDNMEIVTLVFKGSLEHKDSTGGLGQLKAGQMQRMTAGKGLKHSEFNGSKTESVHFLQIWVTPNKRGLEPGYEQKEFASVLKPDQFTLVVAPEMNEGTLLIHQDVRFYMGRLSEGVNLNFTLSSSVKGVYAFVIDGDVQIGKEGFKPGDSAAITGEKQFQVTARKPSLCLLIETSL